MYLPEHFAERRDEEIARIIHAHPLAAIVGQTESGLAANHIPLLRESEARLIGHVALANAIHRELADGAPVLAIFRAGDGYVSPNWYPSKQEHHRHVPTWNYQAVHISGAIRFDHSDKFKRAVVGRLTKHFEAKASGERAWRMADAPADYLEIMLANIVGIRIEIGNVVAKSKLSQNREPADFDNVASELDARGNAGLTSAMRDATP